MPGSTYHAVVCSTRGDPETLTVQTVDRAALQPGEIRIEVHACGVNVADASAVRGTYHAAPAVPFTPGFEAAGVVLECGAAVSALAPGGRVVAAVHQGGWAEGLVTSAAQAVRLPDRLDFAAAAAIPVAFGTGYAALTRRVPIRPGRWLLVQGAGGATGGGALQIGALLGARTIATGNGSDGCARVRRFGAGHVIDYRSEDLTARVREITGGRGVDVVFDAVTGPSFRAALDRVAPEGSRIVCGAAGGAPPEVNVVETPLRSCAIVGVDFDLHLRGEPVAVGEMPTVLVGWAARGWLQPPPLKTFPLDRAGEALAAVAGYGMGGKAVLLPRAGGVR